jgi:MFS family permease
MENNLSDVEQRVKRYWYTDGIGELIGGGMFVLLGIYFALQEFLGQNSMVGGILQASLVLLMIGGTFISRRLVNTLKTRLTYPRTGYVEYQVDERGTRGRRILAVILAFVVSGLTIAFARLFQFFDSIVAVTGVIVALILVVLRAKSSGLTRFYVLGAASLVLGFALSLSGLPNGYSLGLFYGLMGVCSLISGGLTLRRYLKENPLPAETENG